MEAVVESAMLAIDFLIKIVYVIEHDNEYYYANGVACVV